MAGWICENVVYENEDISVFQISTNSSNTKYSTSEWNLEKPVWSGRMKVVMKGKEMYIRLQDKSTGELFAECFVDHYPGKAVEPISNSNQYLVLRTQSENAEKTIGLGFADNASLFDLLAVIQDKFREKKVNKNKSFSQGLVAGLLPPPPSSHAEHVACQLAEDPAMPTGHLITSSEQSFIDPFGELCPALEKDSSNKEDTSDLFANFESSFLSTAGHGAAGTTTGWSASTDKPAPSTESWADFTINTSSVGQPDQHMGNWVSFE